MGSLKSSKTTPKSSHFNSGRTRTRPCIYCGAFFFDFEKLRRHEETEAERFREEREKIQRQRPAQAPSELRLRERGAGGPGQQFSQHHQLRQQAPLSVAFYRIDRTVEEFGEDWEDDQIYPPFYHSRVLKTTTFRHRHLSSQVANNNNNNNNNYDKLHQSPAVLASLASLNPVRPRPQQEQDFQSLGENSWITFEPTRMPKMPESKIVVKSQLEEYLHKLNEEEWVKFIKEQLEPSAPAEVEKEDPNRMDCRHCGLLFNEVHVRKFHEESHRQEREEREELCCGYCGQTFTSLTHKKIHETAHQSLEQPGAAPSQAEFDCRLCGRKFMLEGELAEHNKLLCTAAQPAKPVVTPSRPRLADQEGWAEDDPTLPSGWKIRSRPRATQAGQLFFLFLSPDSKVFHSRKKVIEHMEKLGGYSQFDFDKVREGSKNPRKSVGAGKKQENVLEEEEKEEAASVEKPKAKRKSEEEDWAPKKKAASKETSSEDEEKENKTDVKPKRSKRSRTSFQQYF